MHSRCRFCKKRALLFQLVANYVDYILINIDECKATQWAVGHLLRFPNSWYMTKNDHVPYKKININRIFDLESFVKGVNYFE